MKYEVLIYWSDADEAFIAEVPELAGCVTHGGHLPAGCGQRRGCYARMAQSMGGDGARGSEAASPRPHCVKKHHAGLPYTQMLEHPPTDIGINRFLANARTVGLI